MSCRSYRLAIPLMGKGATNHIHKREVIEHFIKQGINILFLVRKDYLPLLEKIPECDYLPVDIPILPKWTKIIHETCLNIRKRYPSTDFGHRQRFIQAHLDCRFGGKILNYCYLFLARFYFIIKLLIKLEGLVLMRWDTLMHDRREAFDQLLLMGMGAYGAEIEGRFTWWARKNKVSTVHIVGNYDNLSSKGFRGAPISRLLVWGKNMRRDAQRIQHIDLDSVSEIGSIRYDCLRLSSLKTKVMEKKSFVEKIGLDPSKKTIVFAGLYFESQYFEMLSLFDEIHHERKDCQLILRVYPSKHFMHSIYMKPLLEYSERKDNVAVSLADPYYKMGSRNLEVLQIEEFELWNILNSCDVLVNNYSTIALEGCLFDKPVIHMTYIPNTSGVLARDPVYYRYSEFTHNRRLASYNAAKVSRNREELKKHIYESLENPGELARARNNLVNDEIGARDGLVCARLVNACREEFLEFYQ